MIRIVHDHIHVKLHIDDANINVWVMLVNNTYLI